jgi:hypothetical protein
MGRAHFLNRKDSQSKIQLCYAPALMPIRRLLRDAVRRFRSPLALAGSLVLCLLMASVASAQQGRRPAPKSAPGKTRINRPAATPNAPVPPPVTPEVQLEPLPPDASVDEADIAITAHVKAQSLRFDEVPNPTVEFPGQPKRDTVWEAQRENLPTPVEPGVTYRNIGIRLKITSVFSDIDRIVAEALGEIPVVPEKNDAVASKPPSTSKPSVPVLPPASAAPKERQ